MKFGLGIKVFRSIVLGIYVLGTQVVPAQASCGKGMATHTESIPFRLDAGFLILVEGRIGSLRPLRFVVDTGATHTVIDRRIAEELGLRRQPGSVLNFDQQVDLESTTLAEIEIGPLLVRNFPVLVGDLKSLSDFAAAADGIVGIDVLRMSESMKVDYRRRLVSFTFTELECRQWEARTALAMTVQVPVQGRPVRLIVDTGLEGLLFYEDRLRRDLPRLEVSGALERASAGRLRGTAARVPGIALGDERGRRTVMMLPGAPSALPQDIVGYLGTNALHAQMLELDFAGNRLRWQ